MRVAHLLRKYNPAEWGGTETAVKQLLDGLRKHGVSYVVYAPKCRLSSQEDPFAKSGHLVKRYSAFVPVAGISRQQREQLIALGGNLMSYDLIWQLFRESEIEIVHTHTLNRLGGIALTVARLRRVPLVVTIHGGVLDLPDSVKEDLAKPLAGGFEWGKIFGAPLRSRRVIPDADAIVTCNKKEAALLGQKYPGKRIVVQPHGVPVEVYKNDSRGDALREFPQLAGKRFLLVAGRIDPVKNQGWLVQHSADLFREYPDLMLVFAGACTNEVYGKTLKKEVRRFGLEEKVLFTGGLPSGDCRLIGLMQQAQALVVPSLSETFGLVILEAWSAGTPVLATRTSGAMDLIRDDQNGRLFDLDNPAGFVNAARRCLDHPVEAKALAQAGKQLATQQYDVTILAGRIKKLYEQLIEENPNSK